MGQNARNALFDQGCNEGNQTGPAEAGRERKANNNDDLMQCQKKDTGLFPVHLIISDLFFSAGVAGLSIATRF
jgi:hypothetical protein